MDAGSTLLVSQKEWNEMVIPTLYNNILFRSKTEACWAFFFDLLDIRYVYEPTDPGWFKFDTLREWYNPNTYSKEKKLSYMPDFWLPKLKVWVEIKPVEPDEKAQEKAMLLALFTGNPVFICYGNILHDQEIIMCQGGEIPIVFYPIVSRKVFYIGYRHRWLECLSCRRIGLFISKSNVEEAYKEENIILPCDCRKTMDKTMGERQVYNANTDKIENAVEHVRMDFPKYAKWGSERPTCHACSTYFPWFGDYYECLMCGNWVCWQHAKHVPLQSGTGEIVERFCSDDCIWAYYYGEDLERQGGKCPER